MNVPLPSRLETSRRLEVSVPAPMRAPTGRGIHGHSVVVREREIRVWHGIRISSPERVFCELAFPEARVLLEYQSDYHSDPDNFRADMTRRARLEADGWFVMLVNANDFRGPNELVARIRRVIASRG